MRALKHDEIKGNWASLFLKIEANDDIDYTALEKLIDYYVDCEVNGIYSNGTACEFYSQTFDEYKKINELLSEKCEISKMPYQIGASHMSPQESLRRVEYAASLKPSAIQVILPDWFPPNMNTQILFLKKIVEAAKGIGIVLYNPPHAKVVLTPEDYKELLEKVDGIVGIKTAAGDQTWYNQMQEVMKRVSVFVPGHFLATGIKNGAKGSYSNVAALNPCIAQRWYNKTQNDMEEALELEKRICIFMHKYIEPFIIEQKYPNHACDKFMAVVGDWCDMSTKLRWPYIGIEDSEKARVLEAGKELIPEFFR